MDTIYNLRKEEAVKKLSVHKKQNKMQLLKHPHHYTNNNKQTLSAPLLAAEEAAAGSGAGGADVLSKSSNAPVRKG